MKALFNRPFHASSHLWGNGCPICNQSHLEDYVMRVLKSQKIKFETQKAFEWMTFRGKMHLDFFLPEQGVAIECQGEQHFVPSEFFGGEAMYIDTLARDKAKRELCEAHGIKCYTFQILGLSIHTLLSKIRIPFLWRFGIQENHIQLDGETRNYRYLIEIFHPNNIWR